METAAVSRRRFCRSMGVGLVGAAARPSLLHAAEPFAFRWIVASSMYGKLKLKDILPQLPRLGTAHIDIWPRVHADQREQVEEMGDAAFADLLAMHQVKLGISTRYDLGPFALQTEMAFVRKLGGQLIVTGSRGPRGLEGTELKSAVAEFAEKMKPHTAAAEKHGVVIAIENHGNALVQSPDSMKWLAELCPSAHLGIALAPYHLPQDPALIAELIRSLGERLTHFYAWQHGDGCHKKLPKEQELLQMPGRGPLDFVPIVAALKSIGYTRWTSVFMHPVPRGIPILPTAAEVTGEIERAQQHLVQCLAGL